MWQPVAVVDNKCVWGYCDPERLEIRLVTSCHELQTRSAAVHEVTHAIIATIRGEYPDNEEECARLMEAGWFDVMVNNPWFVDYVTGRVGKARR